MKTEIQAPYRPTALPTRLSTDAIRAGLENTEIFLTVQIPVRLLIT